MPRIVAICLCLTFVASVGSSARPDTAQAADHLPPNVLVIVTDDQRAFGTLKVMPQLRRHITDPGVRFPNAYATTPQCCPSRASIMTGQYAHNHGVGNNEEGGNLDPSTTIQRHLSDAGYRTGLVGRYLVEWPVEQAPPYFDDYSLLEKGYYGTRWNINGNIRKVERYSTRFIGTRAERFIEEAEADDDAPWYLYVTPWAPHKRSTPEKRYSKSDVGKLVQNPAMRETDCSDKPTVVDCQASERRVSKERRNMLRTLLSVDDLIGRLHRALVTEGERRRTLVFFLSDNGYLWGEHGLIGKKPPYRGGIEIPMAMSWPGGVEGGITDERLVANIDIAPTIYDAAGIEPDTMVDGRSLLDLEWDRPRLLLEYESFKGWPDWATTLTADFRYTEYYEDTGVTSFTELYRLVDDPWELTNVLADPDPANDPPPEELAQLRAQLNADRRCAGPTCP